MINYNNLSWDLLIIICNIANCHRDLRKYVIEISLKAKLPFYSIFTKPWELRPNCIFSTLCIDKKNYNFGYDEFNLIVPLSFHLMFLDTLYEYHYDKPKNIIWYDSKITKELLDILT